MNTLPSKARPARPMRVERAGDVPVPAERLGRAQTPRALENFPISNERWAQEPLVALAQVKRAAARAHGLSGDLPGDLAAAIEAAADEFIRGRHDDAFPLLVWQTGSGTQTHMHMNEVLANRASELLGEVRGAGRRIHPNDHVNLGQSSNDVIPTAIHVAMAIALALGAAREDFDRWVDPAAMASPDTSG